MKALRIFKILPELLSNDVNTRIKIICLTPVSLNRSNPAKFFHNSNTIQPVNLGKAKIPSTIIICMTMGDLLQSYDPTKWILLFTVYFNQKNSLES